MRIDIPVTAPVVVALRREWETRLAQADADYARGNRTDATPLGTVLAVKTALDSLAKASNVSEVLAAITTKRDAIDANPSENEWTRRLEVGFLSEVDCLITELHNIT